MNIKSGASEELILELEQRLAERNKRLEEAWKQVYEARERNEPVHLLPRDESLFTEEMIVREYRTGEQMEAYLEKHNPEILEQMRREGPSSYFYPVDRT